MGCIVQLCLIEVLTMKEFKGWKCSSCGKRFKLELAAYQHSKDYHKVQPEIIKLDKPADYESESELLIETYWN